MSKNMRFVDAMGTSRTAGGVRAELVATQNFWSKDTMMTALSSGKTQWGDLLVPATTPTVPRIDYSVPVPTQAQAPAAISFDVSLEQLPFADRLSNPFDDLWDTTQLTCAERLQFYTWASVNKWVVTDVTAETCVAGPFVELEARVAAPAPEVEEEDKVAEKIRRRLAAEARQLEIEQRKAALAAEGKPVNRAERRAAEKAAKEAAAAAAAAAE